MTRTLALAAAAAVLAVPISTQAQGAPDAAWTSFQHICWDTTGDYVGSIRAAAADGWADADVVAEDDPAISLTDKAAKSKTVGSEQLSVLVTRGLRKMKDGSQIKVTTCKVTSSGPGAGLIHMAQDWVGAAPDSADPADAPTLAVFFVKAQPGQPDHVGSAGAGAAMSAGGLGVLKFQQEKDGSILVYTVYSK